MNTKNEFGSGADRRGFLKRLSSGLLGGSLLAGTSFLRGQDKKGSAANPGGKPSPAGIQDYSPLIGQVCLFGFNFAPVGWAVCNGQELAPSQNSALFSLLGTTYGGDGITTFGLPNLQAIVPIGTGAGPSMTERILGANGGTQNVTLANNEVPSHNHTIPANSGAGTSNTPRGNFFASNAEGMGQFNSSGNTTLNGNTLNPVGGGLPHNNLPPYLVLNFCIATSGTFPSHDAASSPNQMYGDIILFAGNFVPGGYLACDGSLLSIGTNDVLFNLIGTTYGGDGLNTFAVPDLRGRAPIHVGSGYALGQSGGAETVALTTGTIPSHTHAMQVSSGVGSSSAPGNNYVAANLEGVPQFSGTANTTMNSVVITANGGSAAHENMPPFLGLTYCISNAGVFPT
jgi:microcystin-dependent protein